MPKNVKNYSCSSDGHIVSGSSNIGRNRDGHRYAVENTEQKSAEYPVATATSVR